MWFYRPTQSYLAKFASRRSNARRFLSASVSRSPRPISRTIQTLDWRNLDSMGQQVYDLSGKTGVRFHIPSESTHTLIHYHRSKKSAVKFPPDTVGVLYYRQPPDLPSLAGEIRFRILSDIHHFHEGKDLGRSNGEPWTIHMHSLAKNIGFKGLLAKLIRESLIDESVIADLQKFPSLGQGSTDFQYEFNEPFIIDMANAYISRTFMNQSMSHHFYWQCFKDVIREKGNKEKSAQMVTISYTGRILARLELSHSPERPAKYRGVVVRVLEVLEPLECLRPELSAFQSPVPGHLLMRKKRVGSYLVERPLISYLSARKDGQIIAEFAGCHGNNFWKD
ncbi:hypothetical protein CPB84DRAFT_1826009 [Gymnopilus junonius]|uniref:Uncharacterized protein n=1 Tax=Gymnopilus junonius TaxID=109634 RepID=A0A9P5NKR8_GYMJU|nr:hypothetical protein CPB84DRAFT_1826009 [Gymnopilus junonius]